MPKGRQMRTYHSTPESVLPNSRALRDDSSGALRVEELGYVVVQNAALYLGARSGENGVDGVVVRVPNGSYRVVATVDDTSGSPEVVALSVILSGTTEVLRETLPGAAFWHEAPGDLPLVHGAEIVVADAQLRDQYRDPSWPWDGWLRDVVDPAIQDARGAGRAGTAIPFAGRQEAIIQAAPIEGDVAIFAAFDDERRPTSIHLEALRDAPPTDAPAEGAPPAWVSQAVADIGVNDTPQEHSPFATSTPFSEVASVGQAPVGESTPIEASPVSPPESDRPSLPEIPDEDAPISVAALGSLHDSPETAAQPLVGEGAAADAWPATQLAPAIDPGAQRLADDAVAGVEAADRRDTTAAIALLTQVTDALAGEIGERATVQAALGRTSLTGAQCVDSLVDALLQEQRADEAIRRLAGALQSPQLRGKDDEGVHLRHRLGELQLRSGALAEATATLETARGEADALSKQSAPESRESAEIGHHYFAHITYDLATAQLRSGNASSAADLALEAMRKFESLRVARMAGRSAFLAASAEEELGDDDARQQAFADAERIFRQGRELDGLGTALGFLGESDALRGDYDAAIAKFEEARRTLEEAGELSNASIAAENEAICFDYLGRHDDAAERRRIGASLEQRASNT